MEYFRYSAIVALSLNLFACSRQPSETGGEVLDQKYVHKYGVAVPSEFWETSGEDGQVVSTMADGVVVTRSYKGGILEGETSYTFPHSSQIQKKEFYAQGQLVKQIELFIDGTPKSALDFNTPEPGTQTLSFWYFSGAPKSIERFQGQQLLSGEYFTLDNQRDALVENGRGTRLIRDDYGQLESTDIIVDGMLNSRKTYYPNNSPKEIVSHQNNAIHGIKQTFHPGGEPNTIEQWANGRQDGVTTLFFHGEKYAEVPYVNGKKKGIERRYQDGNQLVQEISWDNDLLNGPSTTYAGSTTKTEWFYQGNPVTESNYQFITNRPMVR